MNTLYVKALYGNLKSEQVDATPLKIAVKNELKVGVTVFRLDANGDRDTLFFVPQIIDAGESRVMNPDYNRIYAGQHFIVLDTVMGGFITAFTAEANMPPVVVSNLVLTKPNDIGPFPQPDFPNVQVPPNGPRVIIAIGSATPNGSIPVRSQYWQRSADSMSLLPRMTRRVEHTVRSGKTETSSQETTMAASVGASASAGWGPISASINASLSMSSMTANSFTISQRGSYTVSDTYENEDPDHAEMIFVWQLVDEVSVFGAVSYSPYQKVLSSLAVVQTPALVHRAGPGKSIVSFAGGGQRSDDSDDQ